MRKLLHLWNRTSRCGCFQTQQLIIVYWSRKLSTILSVRSFWNKEKHSIETQSPAEDSW